MRFTVPFLLAIVVYIATVLGANQTSFNPNEDMLYDIVSASDAIAFRLERALGLPENPALMLGALLLSIPALLTFHLFRVGFGGSVQSLIQDEKQARQHAIERERAAAARYATPSSPRATSGEVLSNARAGDAAKSVDKRETRRDDAKRDDSRRGGIRSNIAAALSGRNRSGDAKANTKPSSGTTSLSRDDSVSASSGAEASESGARASGLKDRWGNLLEKKPDFSRLKTGAQGLRERITPRSSNTTKLSIDDLADDTGGKTD